MKNRYEALLVLNTQGKDDNLKDIVERLESEFQKEGAQVEQVQKMDKRQFSYMAPMDGVDADQLLKKADMALYAAKNGGGGDHRFFALEMEEAAQERRALELDLREALSSDQFQLYFQPLVDLRTGRVTTCEALMRWKHPNRGMLEDIDVVVSSAPEPRQQQEKKAPPTKKGQPEKRQPTKR